MLKKKLLIIIFALFVLAGGIFYQSVALAQGPDLGVAYPAQAGLSNADPRIVTAKIIRVALGLLGTIFLVIVLYGGYLWMTAGGNEDRVGQAKSWIFSGVVGIAIILSAFGITTYILNNLTAATTVF